MALGFLLQAIQIQEFSLKGRVLAGCSLPVLQALGVGIHYRRIRSPKLSLAAQFEARASPKQTNKKQTDRQTESQA